MIKLEIPDYCQDCKEFEPDVAKHSSIKDGFMTIPYEITDTTITCKHQQRCETIKKYLEREMKRR